MWLEAEYLTRDVLTERPCNGNWLSVVQSGTHEGMYPWGMNFQNGRMDNLQQERISSWPQSRSFFATSSYTFCYEVS
jgi:hypothetical protein